MELSLLSRGILTRLADRFLRNCPETAGKSLAARRVAHPQRRPPIRKDFQGGLPFRIWFLKRWGRFSLALLLGTKGTDWTFSFLLDGRTLRLLGVLADFHAERHPFSNFDFSNFGSLPEDVFHFIEDRGVAVRGLVVDSYRVAKLLHQFALLTGQFRGRQHQHVVVQIPFAAAARIGQSLALDAKDRAALRSFGNLQLLFP